MSLSDFSLLRTYDDIREFFKDNKDALEYLKEYEGLDNLLGSGEYGKVWKIKGKELTLKVTSDPDEIRVAKKLTGKNLKTFLKIYASIEVNKLQLRIQEMCYPVERNISSRFGTFFDLVIQSGASNIDQAIEFIKSKKDLTDDTFKDTQKEAVTFIFNVIEDAKKLGLSEEEISELDVHGGNIMQTKQGDLKLVDF